MSAAQIAVPQGVTRKLHAVRGRRRWLTLVSGAALAGAVCAGLLLAAMLLDWLVTPFDSRLRVVLTTIVLVAGAAAWLGWSLRPLLSRSPLPEIAGLVDAAVPQLEERWTTIADLSRTSDPAAMRGSDAMIGQVAREAERLEELVEPQRIVSGRGTRPYLFALCGVLAVFACIWLMDAEQMSVLWRRFWSPTQSISLTRVSSPTADQVVPRHESVAIVGVLENRLRDTATIWLRDPAGETTRHAMSVSTTDPAQFSFLVDDVAAPVEYRIRAGDGQTDWHRIAVADRPRLTSIDFKLTPPAYSRLPIASQAGLPRRTRALAGSVLEVAFTASEPLQEFTLQLGAGVEQSVAPAENGVYQFRQVLNEDFAFSPRLVSRHGLANDEPPTCQIIVYQDQFPSVAIVSPESDSVVRPDDDIEIEFTAKDDFGIARAELVVTDAAHPEGAPLKVVEIPLGDQERQPDVQGRVALDLKEFDLKQGASLSYSVRVFDTKDSAGESRQSASPSAPQTAESSQPQNGDPQNGDPQQPSENQNQLANGDETQKASENPNQLATAGETQKPADSAGKTAQDAAKTAESASKSSSSSSSQNSKTAANAKPNQPSPGGKMEGAPRPGDNMQRRQLNLGQCSSCKPMNLKIDEWAGSFAGQMREKLELAIEEFLARMETALKSAEGEDQGAFDDLSRGTAWGEPHIVGTRKAAGHLTTASDVAVELATKSAGTPYAFMGLQLAEIDERHIVVARGILQSVGQSPAEQRTDELKTSLFHIRRARELLARLSRTYEDAKINFKISEAMTHVSKMHQVFIEDTFKLLGSSRPNLNPKQRKYLELELDEEFRNKLKALLEKKRDVQAELAKVLAEHPELLRRFMSQARLDADSLRDQLTLLARRQAELQGETKSRLETPDLEKGLLESQQARQALEAVEITQQAAVMLENFETWLPKDMRISDVAVQPVHRLYQELAITADQLAVAAVVAPVDPATAEPSAGVDDKSAPAPVTDDAPASPPQDQPGDSQPKAESPNHGQRLYELLGELQNTLPALTDGRPGHTKLTTHVTNRLAEVGKLTTAVSGWLRKVEAADQQDAGMVALIDQTDVTSDTAELTNKIANLKSWMAGLTPEIGQLAKDLIQTLEAELLIQQATAEAALQDHVTAIALVQQTQAVATFAKAEEQFDKLQQAIIDYLDSLPANTKPSLDGATPPSLDELLAMLEDEKLAAEGLGIPCCRPSNLSIVRDWLSPGKNSGSGMGGSMAAGALAQSQSAQQRAGRLQKSADDQRRRLEAALAAAAANQQNGRARPVNPRWNTLQSRLDDSLMQSRGQTPPPKYRSAIELYFELISGVTDEE